MENTKWLLKKCLHYGWIFLASLVILLAVLITIIESLLPQIGRVKEDIELELSNLFNVPVLIGSINAEWRTTGPRFNVNELIINDQQNKKNIITVRSAEIQFNFWHSLFFRQPITSKVSLDGAVINLNIAHDGSVSLEGITSEEQQDSPPNEALLDGMNRVVDIFLEQKEIAIKSSRAVFKDDLGDVEIIEVKDLGVYNIEQFHQVVGDVRVSHAGSIRIVAESEGDPRSDDALIDIYTQLRHWDLSKIPYLKRKIEKYINTTRLDTQLWIERREGSWSHLLAQLVISDIDFSSSIARKDMLSRVGLTLSLEQKKGESWQFKSSDMKIESKTGDIYQFGWVGEVESVEEQSLPNWKLNFSEINIEKIVQILPDFFEEEHPLYNLIEKVSPKGVISSISVSQSEDNYVHAQVNLDNFSMHASDSIPGINNTSVNIDYKGKDNITFVIGAQSATLDSTLFRKPLHLDSLDIKGKVYPREHDWVVLLNDVNVKTPHLNIQGITRLDIKPEQPTDMVLSLNVDKLDSKVIETYLPVNIMKPKLVDFLERSISGGHLSHVDVLMRGPLNGDFPYHEEQGLFSVIGYSMQLDFEFLEEWPSIDEMNSELWFEGNGMIITLDSGKMKDISLNNVTATIENFSVLNPILEIKGEVEAQAENAIEYINATPLSKTVGNALKDHKISGPLALKIRVDAALGKVPEGKSGTSVSGQIDFKNNKTVYLPLDFPSDSLTGTLFFSDTSIHTENLQSVSYGEPVLLGINGKSKNQKMKMVVDIASALDVKYLRNHLNLDILHLLEGKVPFSIAVKVDDKEEKSDIITQITSSLSGVAVDLPFHLKKEHQGEKHLDVTLRQSGKQMRVDFNYDNALTGRVRLNKQNEAFTLFGGKLNVAGKPINRRVTQRGFHINGDIAKLNLKELIEYIKRVEEMKGTKESAEMPKLNITVDVGLADIYGVLYNDLHINAAQPKDDWVINISNEKVDGKVIYKPLETGHQVIGDFNRLVLDEFAEGGGKRVDLDPRDIPSVLVQCTSCAIKNMELGQVEFVGLPMKLGYEIEANANKDKLLKLNLNGTWLKDQEFDLTNIKGTVQSENVGHLLEEWNLKLGIKDSNSVAHFDVHWPDNPVEINIAELAGNLSVEMGQGSVEQVSDRPARLFSLLSLSSLRRRLSLDFSDLYGEGFFYDKLQADFSLGDGWATVNSAKVQGAAADVEISGASDLVNREYDQLIVVSPKLGSSLPIIAGWAIDPSLILLVFVVNQIIEPAVKVFTQIEYKIEGTWDSPVVKEVGKRVEEIPVEKIQKLEQGKTINDKQR